VALAISGESLGQLSAAEPACAPIPTTDRLITEEPETVAAAVRAIVATPSSWLIADRIKSHDASGLKLLW
jgi:hypothetical protein